MYNPRVIVCDAVHYHWAELSSAAGVVLQSTDIFQPKSWHFLRIRPLNDNTTCPTLLDKLDLAALFYRLPLCIWDYMVGDFTVQYLNIIWYIA